MLYFLAFEPFLCNLRANSVLRGFTLLGATISAWYSAYADNVSMLVMSSVEVVGVSKEIGKYVYQERILFQFVCGKQAPLVLSSSLRK